MKKHKKRAQKSARGVQWSILGRSPTGHLAKHHVHKLQYKRLSTHIFTLVYNEGGEPRQEPRHAYSVHPEK